MGSEIKTPRITADVVVLYKGGIVFVERKHNPYKNYLCLPGGHMEIGETIEQTAVREIKEETNLDITLVKCIGVFSEPDRDPRGHVMTVAFIGIASEKNEPRAGDDAAKTIVVSLNAVKTSVDACGNLMYGFDHDEILEAFFRKLDKGIITAQQWQKGSLLY